MSEAQKKIVWRKNKYNKSEFDSTNLRWVVSKMVWMLTTRQEWEATDNRTGEIRQFRTARGAKAYCQSVEDEEWKKEHPLRYPLKCNYINDKLGNTFYILKVNKELDTLDVEAVATKSVYRGISISEFDFDREVR